MFRKAASILVLALAFNHAFAQKKPDPIPEQPDVVQQELELVLVEAAALREELAMVNVKARAAALISFSDPMRSESMFLELWNHVKKITDKDVDKQRAQALILRHLFGRNPRLAKRLMNDEARLHEPSLAERATGRAPNQLRSAALASELVDSNPRAASEILEQSLSGGMSAAGLNALVKLREQNPLLADLVAAKVMTGIRNQPDIVSLSGLQMISAYLFPDGQSVELTSSLQGLRIEFFANANDTLRASLAQPEATLVRQFRYTDGDLRFRAMNQALVAMTLAALAPRYRPDLSVELAAVANRLANVLPANVALSARLSAARLSGNNPSANQPEIAIPMEISNGDFEAANRLISDIRDEEMRKTYLQLVAKLEAKSLLANGDVMGALMRIRRVEDASARLILYLDAVRVAEKKRDAELSSVVVSEARTLIPQVNRNGLQTRALFTFASQISASGNLIEGGEFLAAAVAAINALPQRSEKESARSPTDLAWQELNDPRSMLDAPELDRAFTIFGSVDLDRALIEARRIQLAPVQLVARLEAIGGRIKSQANQRKPKPKSKAPSTVRQ